MDATNRINRLWILPLIAGWTTACDFMGDYAGGSIGMNVGFDLPSFEIPDLATTVPARLVGSDSTREVLEELGATSAEIDVLLSNAVDLRDPARLARESGIPVSQVEEVVRAKIRELVQEMAEDVEADLEEDLPEGIEAEVDLASLGELELPLESTGEFASELQTRLTQQVFGLEVRLRVAELASLALPEDVKLTADDIESYVDSIDFVGLTLTSSAAEGASMSPAIPKSGSSPACPEVASLDLLHSVHVRLVPLVDGAPEGEGVPVLRSSAGSRRPTPCQVDAQGTSEANLVRFARSGFELRLLLDISGSQQTIPLESSTKLQIFTARLPVVGSLLDALSALE